MSLLIPAFCKGRDQHFIIKPCIGDNILLSPPHCKTQINGQVLIPDVSLLNHQWPSKIILATYINFELQKIPFRAQSKLNNSLSTTIKTFYWVKWAFSQGDCWQNQTTPNKADWIVKIDVSLPLWTAVLIGASSMLACMFNSEFVFVVHRATVDPPSSRQVIMHCRRKWENWQG